MSDSSTATQTSLRPQAEAYWRERFAGTVPPLELPTDRPRTARPSHAAGSLTVKLGDELAAATRAAAGWLGLGFDVWCRAAFHALLHRLTGQNDFVVGTTLPRPGGPGGEPVPLRVATDPEQPFRELARAVDHALGEAAEHFPFPAADVPVRLAATFDTAPASREPRHELEATLADAGADCELRLDYAAELFDRETVGRWAGHYRTLLASAAADPDTAVGRLAVLTAAELRQIVEEFNATAADYPRDLRTDQLVSAQAARTPDRVAVSAGGERLTYAELEARANRLAHHLRALGVGPDVPVGLFLRRETDMVVGMLAVWKAGGGYVPLDPDFPAARLKLYLEDSGAPIVVTQADLRARLPATTARVVDLDAERAAIAARPAEAPPAAVGSPEDLAYLIYTSGSTGTPNGVVIGHRALTNFVTLMRAAPGVRPDDVVAAVTTMSFDIHHLDLWLPLTAGARAVLLPRDVAVDGSRLAEEMERFGVTVLQATPATWRLLLTADWPGRPGLKAISGGESLPPEMAARLLTRVGELWNGYGPTETTVYSTMHRVADATGPIPIGRPIANTRVYILDPLRQPVPVGCVGEIYIGGDGLARGYRNRPAVTAARFVPDPLRPGERMYKTGDLGRFRPDGVIECLGRVDHQVKLRGHRIELGEVEAALAATPGVAAAAVRVWGDPPQLAGYVTARPGEALAPDRVRRQLRERLPDYMVPGTVTVLPALPLTPNGKIDRKALPEPAAVSTDRPAAPPRTDAERDVLAVWADVLRRPNLGVTDDFFDLGGTSLQAAELVALVRRRLGHTLPLGALYEAATVEKMAALIQHRLEAGAGRSLVPLQTGGSRPPLFMIAGVGGHVFTFHKFARLLGPEFPVYGLKAIGVDGGRTPPESFEEIAAEYVREITAACPHGPYVLSGYSIGALVAVEVALRLQALGHEVPLVIVFDMTAPGYPPHLSAPRRLALHARNLFRREGGGVRYALRRVRNLGNRVLRSLGLESWLFPHHPSLKSFPQESLRAAWVALQRARRRYRPDGRLGGSVALFRSEIPMDVWDAVVNTDPCLGWRELADGPVEVRRVSRGHLEVFHDDNIEWLAREVAEAIRRATAGEAAAAPAPTHPAVIPAVAGT